MPDGSSSSGSGSFPVTDDRSHSPSAPSTPAAPHAPSAPPPWSPPGPFTANTHILGSDTSASANLIISRHGRPFLAAEHQESAEQAPARPRTPPGWVTPPGWAPVRTRTRQPPSSQDESSAGCRPRTPPLVPAIRRSRSPAGPPSSRDSRSRSPAPRPAGRSRTRRRRARSPPPTYADAVQHSRPGDTRSPPFDDRVEVGRRAYELTTASINAAYDRTPLRVTIQPRLTRALRREIGLAPSRFSRDDTSAPGPSTRIQRDEDIVDLTLPLHDRMAPPSLAQRMTNSSVTQPSSPPSLLRRMLSPVPTEPMDTRSDADAAAPDRPPPPLTPLDAHPVLIHVFMNFRGGSDSAASLAA